MSMLKLVPVDDLSPNSEKKVLGLHLKALLLLFAMVISRL